VTSWRESFVFAAVASITIAISLRVRDFATDEIVLAVALVVAVAMTSVPMSRVAARMLPRHRRRNEFAVLNLERDLSLTTICVVAFAFALMTGAAALAAYAALGVAVFAALTLLSYVLERRARDD
jgi:O-antigen/teichoic acid export membrane protein